MLGSRDFAKYPKICEILPESDGNPEITENHWFSCVDVPFCLRYGAAEPSEL